MISTCPLPTICLNMHVVIGVGEKVRSHGQISSVYGDICHVSLVDLGLTMAYKANDLMALTEHGVYLYGDRCAACPDTKQPLTYGAIIVAHQDNRPKPKVRA